MFLKEVITGTSMEHVGRRLKLFRLVLGKRQIELARECGWSPQKWVQWENAKRLPNLPDMIELAERYEISLDYIYRGDMSHLPAWMAHEIREIADRLPLDVAPLSTKPHPVQGNNRVRLVAHWRSDKNYRFVTNNCAFDVLRDDLGRGVLYPYSPIGRTRWELSDGDPDDVFWRAHIADLDARRPFRNFRYPITTRSGRFVWVISTGHPEFEGGAFSGYSGFARFLSIAREVQQAAG